MDIPVCLYELFFGDTIDEDTYFMDYVKSLCEKYGINYFNNRIEFYEQTKNEKNLIDKYYQNEGDLHPAELLNDFYANNILNILKTNYESIIGKKELTKEFNLEINDYLPYSIQLNKIDEYTYSFKWSNETLNYPLNSSYIKLNFKYPIKLKEIILKEDNISNSSIWYNKYNEDKIFNKLPGIDNIYDVNDEVYSLNIHVDLKNINDDEIIIKFEV